MHLEPLSSNGGPTLTIALGPGSLAIDAGRDATCLATDQRGVTRPQGPHCDSGAYEAILSEDTHPPVVTPPADVTVPATDASGAVVSYDAATAVDDLDGPLTPTCDPPPGSLFAVGTTTVTCQATDAAGNTGEATFTVTVRPFVTAPVVSSISPTSGPAAGGTVVTVTGSGFSGTSAVDFGGVAAADFTIDSDTSLSATSPAGTGAVDITVTSPSGTSATSSADLFTYAAPPDTVAPVVTPPADVTTVATDASGALVTYGAATAVDDRDGPITPSCDPPSGSLFAVGETTVTCTATDAAGNTGEATFLVTVGPFVVAPAVTSINPVTGPAAGGTVVTITGSGFSSVSAVSFGSTAAAAFTIDSDASITATSPAGTGMVDLTVMSPSGTSATSSADLFTYAAPPDTVAPVVTPPADVSTAATDASGAVVSYDAATALDDHDGPITPACDPASGSLFAVGAHHGDLHGHGRGRQHRRGDIHGDGHAASLRTRSRSTSSARAPAGSPLTRRVSTAARTARSRSTTARTSRSLRAQRMVRTSPAGPVTAPVDGLTCVATMTAARTVTATFTLPPVGTSTVITSDTSTPTVVGQPYEVDWSVTLDGPAVGTADGSVTLSDGTDACTATATAGTCTLTSTTSGLKHLVARFTPSDATQAHSTSDPVDHQVDPAATRTTILSDTPDPSQHGATYVVAWSVVVVAPGAGTPTGTVTVADDKSASCSAAVAAGSCVMPSSPAGTRTLTATFAPAGGDLTGSADTATHTIVAGAPLSVTSVSPASLGRGAHDTLDVFGSGFSVASTVAIGRINLIHPTLTFVDSTHLRVSVDIPLTTGLGAHDVSVHQGAGGPSANCQRCLTIVAFALTSVDPATLDRGTSALFDIRGAGFSPSTRVDVHGAGVTAATPTFIDSTHLRVLLTATSNAALTAHQVDVTSANHGGVSATCPTCRVTIVVGAHLSVTSVSPASLGRGAHDTLDVFGSGFSVASTVAIGGINLIHPTLTFVDSTHLRVSVDIPLTTGLGAHDVSVHQGAGGQSANCQRCLTIVAFALTSVDPATLDRGTSALFDIRGAGFSPSTRVDVHGAGVTAATPTFIDSTHLRVLLTATSNAALTAHQVDVTSANHGGVSATCPTCRVTIVVGGPSVRHHHKVARGLPLMLERSARLAPASARRRS